MARSKDSQPSTAAMQRTYLGSSTSGLQLPNLIKIQHDSFEWLMKEGVNEVIREVVPIDDYTGKNLSLELGEVRFEDPKYTVEEAILKRASYE